MSVMSRNSIIKVENLKRTFIVGSEEVHALKGVSFEIFQGEFVSIMGSSGSGKSTLLNILGCLDQPTSGEFLLITLIFTSVRQGRQVLHLCCCCCSSCYVLEVLA